MAGAAGDSEHHFGDGLAAAGHAILADARKALSDPQLSDANAVHDLRKALKRWRALMRLLAGVDRHGQNPFHRLQHAPSIPPGQRR